MQCCFVFVALQVFQVNQKAPVASEKTAVQSFLQIFNLVIKIHHLRRHQVQIGRLFFELLFVVLGSVVILAVPVGSIVEYLIYAMLLVIV